MIVEGNGGILRILGKSLMLVSFVALCFNVKLGANLFGKSDFANYVLGSYWCF